MHTHETSIDPGCNEVSRPKHFEILDAVERLTAVRFAVQTLCDDIMGVQGVPTAGPKDGGSETIKTPCLLDVLDNTPSIISQESQMITKAVEEIRLQIL